MGDIVFENPYYQSKSSKWAGCQIDYMIQTRYNTLYVCEIKFSHHPITPEVIKEMKAKLKALKVPKGYSAVPVLIHLSGLTDALVDAEYFVKTIDFNELLAKE